MPIHPYVSNSPTHSHLFPTYPLIHPYVPATHTPTQPPLFPTHSFILTSHPPTQPHLYPIHPLIHPYVPNSPTHSPLFPTHPLTHSISLLPTLGPSYYMNPMSRVET
ncbi:hypothetical protein Pcinc_001451 [Petrolisthes cinctipes]|uniref:Uncharacterized protein n=1 Tax=Petrolisthes cinctipes TaxID=88211 RepID=A0AAE1GK35_PETCI|nr:hypothetical protein Pcinc_001451 [Petrolisthes cinctipes]